MKELSPKARQSTAAHHQDDPSLLDGSRKGTMFMSLRRPEDTQEEMRKSNTQSKWNDENNSTDHDTATEPINTGYVLV